MNELLDEKYIEYRKKIREFAESIVKLIAIWKDEKEEFPVDLAQKMGVAGLFGITVPKKYGGQGLDYLSYIIAVVELARVDSSPAATIAAHNSLGINPIYTFGTEEQWLKYLPDLSTEDKLWAFGLTENKAGSDAKGVETEATPESDQWIIKGSKMFITNSCSSLATGITIQAITGTNDGKKELSAILLDRSTPGYETSDYLLENRLQGQNCIVQILPVRLQGNRYRFTADLDFFVRTILNGFTVIKDSFQLAKGPMIS